MTQVRQLDRNNLAKVASSVALACLQAVVHSQQAGRATPNPIPVDYFCPLAESVLTKLPGLFRLDQR
jgi:hypothetical protein